MRQSQNVPVSVEGKRKDFLSKFGTRVRHLRGWELVRIVFFLSSSVYTRRGQGKKDPIYTDIMVTRGWEPRVGPFSTGKRGSTVREGDP